MKLVYREIDQNTSTTSDRQIHCLAPYLALVIYVCLSFLWFGSRGSWTKTYLGGASDPIQFMWFLKWWPFAIGKGINPFWTHYVWFPHGFDLAWATSVPTLAILAAPLTIVTNPVFVFNVISTLSPAMSAWTGYLLARDITRDDAGALIAGFIYGFSSYEFGQLLGHLNLDTIFLIPLIVLLVLRRFRGHVSRSWFISLAVLGLFVELGISMEIVASFCTLGAIVWAVFWFFGPKEDRRRLWALALEIVIVGCILVVTALPYLWFMIIGASTAPDSINSVTYFSADLLNFFMPTWTIWLGHQLVKPIVDHFSGNISEQGAYLGVPLIGILVASAFQFRHNKRIRALLISIGILVLASLGPELHITGHGTGVSLPWALASKLPLIRSALPTRFTMYIALEAGLVAALWIGAGKGRGRTARIFIAVVACLFLIPNPLAYAWRSIPHAPSLGKSDIQALLGPSPNLLILPFASAGPSMAWQLDANMAFTQSGGYVGFTPTNEEQWTATRDFIAGAPSGDFINDLSAFCVAHRVTAILMAHDTPKLLARAILSTGWHAISRPDMTIVKVPPPATLDYYMVTGDYWPSGNTFNWIGRNATLDVGDRPLHVIISGKDRPSILLPVKITVTIGGTPKTYEVRQDTRVEFTVPPHSKTRFHAGFIFRPDRVIHNKDHRRLSVEIAISELTR